MNWENAHLQNRGRRCWADCGEELRTRVETVWIERPHWSRPYPIVHEPGLYYCSETCQNRAERRRARYRERLRKVKVGCVTCGARWE